MRALNHKPYPTKRERLIHVRHETALPLEIKTLKLDAGGGTVLWDGVDSGRQVAHRGRKLEFNCVVGLGPVLVSLEDRLCLP